MVYHWGIFDFLSDRLCASAHPGHHALQHGALGFQARPTGVREGGAPGLDPGAGPDCLPGEGAAGTGGGELSA